MAFTAQELLHERGKACQIASGKIKLAEKIACYTALRWSHKPDPSKFSLDRFPCHTQENYDTESGLF